MAAAAVVLAHSAADLAETHARLAATAADGGAVVTAAWEADLTESCADDAEAAFTAVLATDDEQAAIEASISARDAWAAFARASASAMDAWAAAHSRAIDRLRWSRDRASRLMGLDDPRDPPTRPH